VRAITEKEVVSLEGPHRRMSEKWSIPSGDADQRGPTLSVRTAISSYLRTLYVQDYTRHDVRAENWLRDVLKPSISHQ